MAKTINCIKELETKHVTFKPGETYAGNKINERWWVIEAVAVSVADFILHFKEE